MDYLVLIIKYALFGLIGILGLGFLIGFHELGHFLFCKLFRIKTPSFSIGMGPKIFSKKIGDTEFSLSAIPLGGYVEIAGNEEVGQGDQKEAKRDDEFSFANKPYYQKMFVMFGGILFNLFFSYVAFIGLYKVGIPKIAILFPEDQKVVVKRAIEGSIAEKAGIEAGDLIQNVMYNKGEGIANEEVNNIPEFINLIKNIPEQKITILVRRKSETKDINLITSKKDEDGNVKIGIEFDISQDIPVLDAQSWSESIKSGISATNMLIAKTFSSFKNLISRNGVKKVGGPLLILQEAVKSAERGYRMFFILLALISINLAVLNLLPFPILDGGQIATVTIETILRRKLPEKTKNVIHIACWILILGLMILLTFWDIKRIFM